MPDMITMRRRPCPTCPYRRDSPSGIWSEDEYDKLPPYDLDTTGQMEAGAHGAFYCHSTPDVLCAGWVGCHDMRNNLGLRLAASFTRRRIDPQVYDYQCPVPLFASGAEAAEHGKRDLDNPSPRARRMVLSVVRKIARRTPEQAGE